MRHIRILLALTMAASGVSLVSTTALAGSPQPVTASFQAVFAGGPHGTFSATAPLPTAGTFVDSPVAPSIRAGVIHVTRVMSAAGGTVEVTWSARFAAPGVAEGFWAVTGGTGDFANLHAQGTTEVVLVDDSGATESWQGSAP